MGNIQSLNESVSKVADTVGDIFMFVVGIMCAVLLAAIILLWIIDRLKSVQTRDDRIAELEKIVDQLKAEKANGYKKNEESCAVTDKVLDMYLTEKNRADSLSEQVLEWDRKRTLRIAALENQLRENGIEPITWEKIKFAA